MPRGRYFVKGFKPKGLVMKKRVYLLLLLLPVVSFFIPVHAERIEIYDKDWNLKYRVDNGRVYDRDWNLKYRIEKDRIYDSNWNLKYRISEDKIYDSNWNLKGRIKDDIIYDSNWNLKARIKKIKGQIMNLKDRILGGLWGAVTGDALGVPVEFEPRYIRKKDPVVIMRGYGTFNLPPGSWSDDSSLMLCTVESLLNGFDTKHMAELFVKWLTSGYQTPFGKTFDVGRTTYHAIMKIINGTPPEDAGLNEETDNGNGSLMRILPVGIYFTNSPDEDIISYAHRASSLTHRHPRSLIACGIYCLMVSSLIKGKGPIEAYKDTVKKALTYYKDKKEFKSELSHFDRVLSGNISKIDEDDIESDGYVVHTLEASLWCLLNTESYRDAVLKAVNLGYDTDTIGIVTGGLAGIHYSLNNIPKEWINTIARKDDIALLFEKFLRILSL